jgi:hypothetical protein
MSSPFRRDLQSRRTSRGNVGACHHLAWQQMVPAPCFCPGRQQGFFSPLGDIFYSAIGSGSRGNAHLFLPCSAKQFPATESIRAYARVRMLLHSSPAEPLSSCYRRSACRTLSGPSHLGTHSTEPEGDCSSGRRGMRTVHLDERHVAYEEAIRNGEGKR